jgi:hypothetical protein
MAAIFLVLGGATASAQDEATNNGEDLTRPLNRFDVRLQYETLPDMDEFHEEFDNRDQETLTLRSDLVFFQKPDQIGLRIDLPIIWNNKPNTENRTGSVQSGLGVTSIEYRYGLIRGVDSYKNWIEARVGYFF